MKRKLVLILCASLMFASISTIAATQNTSSLALSGMPGEGIELDVSRTAPEFTSISIDNPDIQVVEMVENFETYQLFALEGEPFIQTEGNPSVPQITRLYRIPNTGGVDLVIRNAEFEIQNGINPYPYVAERSSFNRDNRNLEIYTKSAWYPQEIATISEPMILRDFRVVTVTLHPVQVNPVTGQARIYSQISVDVVANGQPGVNELLNPRRPSGNWAPVYRDVIANLDETALDDATTNPGTYMIISRDCTIVNMFRDSLVEWKTRRGYDVVVDTRPSWSVSQMTTAIRTQYANADPPLEFVCIMGDPTGSYSVPTDGSSWDHTFALGNTGDDLEDIGVGRLACTTQQHFATVNSKIMGYERNPYMGETDWYTKAFLYAGISNEIASNYTLMQWGDTQLQANTGYVNNTVLTVNGSVNNSVVEGQLEDGRALFMWRGGWIGQMGTGLAAQCNVGWKLPLCWTVTCATGNFEGSTADVSETWLISGTPTNPAGGICGIGTATASTHAPQNICLAGGLLYAIANQRLEHLGNILSSSKVWLSLTFGAGSSSANNFSRYCNLMGDPGLSLWTDIPVIMDVTHPTTLNVGARQVTVTVLDPNEDPIEDALVVLWKGTFENRETYVRAATNSSGQVILPVTVNTAGTMRLTVTKRNHKPYLFEIPCVVANQMLSYESLTLDDDMAGGTSGNNNGELNPGETVDLTVTLKNHGSTGTASGISATLSCVNPNITVLNATSAFPDIAASGQQVANNAFRITASPTMKQSEIAQLILSIVSNGGPSSSAVNLPCKAGAVEFISNQFIGGSLNPGDTRDLRVTIKNTGELDMSGVTGHLISRSPFVSVDNPIVTYGNIAIGQEVNNNADLFTLTANSLAFPGHQANLLFIAETTGGYRDSTQFTIYAGTATSTDPAGPDGYGYYAYDNTDTEYELAPDFNYVNISSGLGTNLGINDIGEKTQISQLFSTVRDLPFPVTYYGISYDQVTVCSNGWIAFGDQGWNDNFRNYPIPAMVGADAMICPYWDDLKTSGGNQGVWEYYDAAEGRYIIQWKAGVGSSFQNALDFQVMLLDTANYPTLDGNNSILFQYNDLPATSPTNQETTGWNETTGCTIGIHNETATVGLALAYQNDYAPGVANWVDGRAVMITTNARALFGKIEGYVRDAATSQPMENAQVSLDGFNYHDETDANGFYQLNNVLIGEYVVRAHQFGYNDATVEGILVELDSTEVINLSMLHPEFTLSTDEIYVTIPPEEPSTSFDIINDGNGPLDYSIEIVYTGGGEPVDPWGNIEDINVSGLTGDMQILGCEFVGDYWYVSGGSGMPGNNKLYKFNLDGEYVGFIPQPSSSAFGWYDLAYDGNYIYGSEDGTNTIQGIDESGTVRATIPSPLNPTRAIAYDPATDHFWVADYTQNIYEINRGGQVFSNVPNEGANELAITGLAWNPTEPDGFNLYIYSQIQDSPTQQTLVSRMHPVSYDIQHLTVLAGEEGDHSGGCAVTGGWNSTLLVFGAIMQNSSGDRLGIYQVDFNTVWINVDPMISSVAGGTSRELAVTFDTGILRTAVYEVSLLIYNDILDTTLELPVTLDVTVDAEEPNPNAGMVTEYVLHQNYPNPFNPSTTIRYDLKNPGHTTLAIYNIVGQEVAKLVNEVQQSGPHAVHFDASGLTSGVYFYRLKSGDFSSTSKMVLMK
ncbi:carboxypeptidase regulatory-like domain-containing protein [bacterium]|nr:carboxypeptidase regulatory-like domain-containing protein [bacterium]